MSLKCKKKSKKYRPHIPASNEYRNNFRLRILDVLHTPLKEQPRGRIGREGSLPGTMSSPVTCITIQRKNYMNREGKRERGIEREREIGREKETDKQQLIR
jgi:hypothetical protein